MRDFLKTVPNQLTAARLVLIPVMWLFAWLKLPFYIGIGMFISFLTDAFDGYIARKLKQVSKFGSQFDSTVDNILLPSALVWLWLFRSTVFSDHILLCTVAVVLYFVCLIHGAVKFRRFANLHLYSSKAAAVAEYIFISHALVADRYDPLLFYIAAVLFLLSSVEALLLQLVCSKVNEHMGSLFLVWRRGELE